MIRPHHFSSNPQTAADNVFQDGAPPLTGEELARAGYEASTRVVDTLREAGVRVHVFEDESAEHPDSVFPNNWFSTHSGGRIAMYPMYTPNRRGERRADVVEFLKTTYRVQEVVDYSGMEQDGLYLEGTGAMVLDHIARIAYTARSRRADPVLLERFCTTFGYEPMFFDAADDNGTAIYHTNVMMCIATEFALVGLDAIVDDDRRAEIVARLEESGRTVIPLSHEQIRQFAGNAIELRGGGKRLLALSVRAAASLTPAQRELIEASCELVPLDVSTIELAGGSVRCMLAGIHLDPRPDVVAAR